LEGHEVHSFLDGFSGYNQVKSNAIEQHKTTFDRKWGPYAYSVMPFGLSNPPGTFQRMICHSFDNFHLKFLKVFMDEFCLYSSDIDHLDKLRLVLEDCIIYGIALNMEKNQIMVSHGEVLCHIVSRRGISMNDNKVKVILILEPHQTINKFKLLSDT